LCTVDFHVFAITHSPTQRPVFSTPTNVRSTQTVPLWGTEQPGCEILPFSQTYRRKLRTSPGVIRSHFLEPFELALRSILDVRFPSVVLAHALLRLHRYFQDYDYGQTVSSLEAWEAFLRISSEMISEPDRKLNVEESTLCMRWLQRYLAVLSYPYPLTDLTHASMAGLAGIPGVIQKVLHGSGFLLSEHGIFLREFYIAQWRTGYSEGCKRFLLTLNEAIVRMNYHFADTVTALCEFNKHWQLRLGACMDKIRILPNGVDPETFYARKGGGPERPTVLTMSHIFPLKGIDVLLRAALLVREHVPNVRLRILGNVADEDYYRECLRFVAEHGLKDSIAWGHTKDPAAAYHEAHVFCLPSISEAMPYSLLEAMHSGCPVVATDVGGVAEILGRTGLVVKPRDPEALARGLLFLLEPGHAGEERRSRLASAALSRAMQRYTIEGAVQRFAGLYRNLASPLRSVEHEGKEDGIGGFTTA
jgi:glycosyltransferase involved in cell wall biosynthesis